MDQIKNKAGRLDNLHVANIRPEAVQALAGLASRTMRLQCTIQDGQIWLADGQQSIQVEVETWKP